MVGGLGAKWKRLKDFEHLRDCLSHKRSMEAGMEAKQAHLHAEMSAHSASMSPEKMVAEKRELVQFLLRIYNGPHTVNFTAKFRLQCMKCLLLFPLCKPLRGKSLLHKARLGRGP